MRSITVSVDYGDILAITLPYMRHHFTEAMVVTTPSDCETIAVANANHCQVHQTKTFYARGALFNKWAALEEALDLYGRHGWLCILDADVVWPREFPLFSQEIGKLYAPLCRWVAEVPSSIPPESAWRKFPLRPNRAEWAGYTQIFHAGDPVLGDPPWHQTNWIHAGGADSFFQRKWAKKDKVRLPFEALHLGPHGRNWCGRVTQRLDKSLNPQAEERQQQLTSIFQMRRKTRNFGREKLKE